MTYPDPQHWLNSLGRYPVSRRVPRPPGGAAARPGAPAEGGQGAAQHAACQVGVYSCCFRRFLVLVIVDELLCTERNE